MNEPNPPQHRIEVNPGRSRVLLVIMSGALLGVAYPPLPFGIVAAVAFVPFFLLFEEITTYGEALRLSYGVFFVFNLITLYWTGGFTHAKDIYLMSAGTAVLVFHPMFSWAAIVPWMFVRKRLGNLFAVCAFPFVWVVYEWVRSLTEYSFPWLTLGNTQTYNLPVAQMVQWTGVYGISFWLLCLNVLLYLFANGIARKRWKLASPETLGVLGCIIIVYSLPQLYGYSVLKHARPESSGGNPIRIGIVQPNIDPFEKWTGPVPKEIAIQESMTVVAAKSKASLILWSETGIPQAVLTPYHAAEFADLRSLIDSLHTNFLTGYIGMVVYPQHGPYPKSSKISIDGARYDEFNSALLVRWNSPDTQKYNKILLVPYAERVPYSEFLSFLNAMQWNFGLGGWGIGKDTTIFHFQDTALIEHRFANMICYESVYPDFVRQFVLKGAEFITVITNDSWWGNTSGAYQHKQYAVLRAIENRRWVVQCANGGISCIIDPYGNTVQATEMYERKILIGDIVPRTDLTFYTKHGDWLAHGCLAISLGFLVLAIVRRKK